MPTITQSNQAKGVVAVPYPDSSGDVNAVRYSMAVPTNMIVGDILELGCIPAGCRVVDLILDCDDIDTNGAPTVAFDVGIMSGAWGDPTPTRTCGAEFFSASNVGQAGTVARPTLKSAFQTAPVNTERSIGVKMTAAAATPAVGNIGLTVLFVTL